ncbi:MAG: hypothetical protein K2O89_01225 [Clostridia bacterium]|nr:hypothetical protein [Clostridia bacterium]
MEENQAELRSVKKKYIAYKIVVMAFIAVIMALVVVLLLLPTIELNVQNSLPFTKEIGENLNDTQAESMYNYLKKSNLTPTELAAFANSLDGRCVSFLDFLILSFSNDFYRVLSKDGIGAFGFIFIGIIDLLLIVMILFLLISFVSNLLLILSKKSLDKTLLNPVANRTVREERLDEITNFFTIKYCVGLTVILVVPFILKILVALSKQPNIFVDNYYSSSMYLSLKYLPVSYVLSVVGCVLMYIFTIISSKLNPLRK